MAYINGKEILFSPAVNYTDENPILEAEASRAQKELANMKALGVVETMQEDNAIAYRKTVPANALPYAEVKEIGGMTYTSKNIFNANAVNKSNIVVADNGASITVTGDPNGDYNSTGFYFEKGETYCATYGGTGTLYYVPAPAALTEIKSGVPFTIAEGVEIGCLAFGTNGGTFTNLMIIKGEQPADFAPYIEGGMANAAVTQIETVGYNILDLTPALNDCLTDNGDGTYTLRHINGSRFSASFPFPLPKESGNIVNCSVEIIDKSTSDIRLQCRILNPATNTQLSSFQLVEGGQDYAIGNGLFQAYLFRDGNAEGDYITFRNPSITLGYGYKGYKPYAKHTLPIPLEVQALDGWGLGVNEAYHNRIVWDVANGVKQYRQEVGIVDMGDLTYSMRVSNGRNIFGTASLRQTIRGFVAGDNPLPAVAVGYKAVRVADTWKDGEMAYGSNAEGYTSIEFVNNAYTTAEDFKAAMRGRYLVYALAEPIVTDLKDALLADNFIAVEGGGAVTAVNANGFDVPTTIEYRVKG